MGEYKVRLDRMMQDITKIKIKHYQENQLLMKVKNRQLGIEEELAMGKSQKSSTRKIKVLSKS